MATKVYPAGVDNNVKVDALLASGTRRRLISYHYVLSKVSPQIWKRVIQDAPASKRPRP